MQDLNREIAEALGWKSVQHCRHPHHLIGVPPAGETSSLSYCDGALHHVPDFLSPAVLWPEFEKWRKSFEVNKPGFSAAEECGNEDDSDYVFIIELWTNGKSTADSRWRDFDGASKESITEAGCKAWLAAIKASQSA